MLNLFQHLTNWACSLHSGKTLNLFQGDNEVGSLKFQTGRKRTFLHFFAQNCTNQLFIVGFHPTYPLMFRIIAKGLQRIHRFYLLKVEFHEPLFQLIVKYILHKKHHYLYFYTFRYHLYISSLIHILLFLL